MTLAAGSTLGPYEVVELLGAGGMGEVYRARDARLGRDVAVKVLPGEVAQDAQRLSFFEREARAVAALNHPNILTVHDVGTDDGVPYVVTELLEGENLRELVSRRTPTVRQIMAYALQAARGLEAAHSKDIVHRDLKPENLFLTTEGRVKVLDFGLAKLVRREKVHSDAPTPSRSTAAGQVVGTVAYMSPEQARGQPVDPRSDVFSFGVVLYELLAGKHPFRRETMAATLTALVEETPAGLESLNRGIAPAVGGIVRRCLEKAKEDRYGSGHDVVVALDAVLAAPTGAAALLEVEERSPYPGLSFFTEKDAGIFFGRESEVEELWGRIRNRRLLAVIGPSGAGKTSFVRAGVVASRPEGWAAVYATPGSNPSLGFARGLTPDLAGDPEAISELLTGVVEFSQTGEAERVVNTAKRWRSRYAEALLVMDQFEELFTLNPPEMQARIAALLKRLTSEADVHVVLSMRDDFLIRCSAHKRLAPVFESLTPLPPLSPEGLRRAVVEPAKKRGYRFEDEAFVDEIVSNVEGVRAALPLLAFAVARLWEKRDREEKLLTRAAYQEIAGVEGALAQHAEATMDRIGSERHGVVREIFRNLVTAQGTRAVIDREELLSAFPDRPIAEGVLGQLIDARLLTSYEVKGKEDEPSHHRIEVVHESLLKAWPRLVRWQTQDEEGALLRDQLKQAAHLWEEKGRTPDLLWSGTAFREYELWRDRYPGALSALEDDFARAMVHRARRRKRLRTVALVTFVVGLSAVAATIAVSRQREATARRQAEAAELLALGRLELEDHPTAGLAYALASLELTDTPAARGFALETLAHGGAAFVLDSWVQSVSFSRDGQWLATASVTSGIQLWSREGGPPIFLGSATWFPHVQFDPRGPLLLVRDGETMRIFSVPNAQPKLELDHAGAWPFFLRDSRLFTFTQTPGGTVARARPLGGGEARSLGPWDDKDVRWADASPSGAWLAYARGRQAHLLPMEDLASPARRVGEHAAAVRWVAFAPGEDRLMSSDEAGEIRIWSFHGGASTLERAIRSDLERPFAVMDRTGSTLVLGQKGATEPPEVAFVWDLNGPPDADPLVLRNGDVTWLHVLHLDPSGQWLATAHDKFAAVWSLGGRRARIIRVQRGATFGEVAFTPDGRWLASASDNTGVRLWPLSPTVAPERRILFQEEGIGFNTLAIDPMGRKLIATSENSGVAVLAPLDGVAPQTLPRSAPTGLTAPGFSRDGLLAAAGTKYRPEGNLIELWDMRSGEVRTLDPRPKENEKECGFDPRFRNTVFDVEFTSDGRLLSAGHSGLRLWNLDAGTNTLLRPCSDDTFSIFGGSLEDRFLLLEVDQGQQTSLLSFHDLRAKVSRDLTSHGNALLSVALDRKGEIAVTGDYEGLVRVGPPTNDEPHLLHGHDLPVTSVAVSPDGRWVASWSRDGTIRLWPMPTGRPFHTLPYEELLARLRSFTNLRVARDEGSETGYRVEVGPFPGWKDVPTW